MVTKTYIGEECNSLVRMNDKEVKRWLNSFTNTTSKKTRCTEYSYNDPEEWANSFILPGKRYYIKKSVGFEFNTNIKRSKR